MNRKVTGFTWLAVLAGLLGANVALAQGNSGNNGNGLSGQVDALGVQHNADIAAVNAAISAIELMPGPAGTDGQDGAPGADGADGAPGVDGVDGAPGVDGTNGIDGLNGATGPAGPTGPPGPPGADGTNGVDGAPGADGLGVPSGGVFGDVMYWNGASWIATSGDKHQPSLGMNYIIALQGIFPSRNGQEPFIGEIIMFAGNFAPRGWAFCDGQLLPISQNTALFSLVGTIYGGDGRTTFALPDLRGRVPVGEGTGPGLPNVRQGVPFGTANH